MAEADPKADQDTLNAAPVVVRCRGTRYKAAEGKFEGNPHVTNTEATDTPPQFLLDVSLVPNKEGPIFSEQKFRFPEADDEWREKRASFNSAAQGFAEISAEYLLVVSEFRDFPNDQATANAWLETKATEIETFTLNHDELSGDLKDKLKEIAPELRQDTKELDMIWPPKQPFEEVKARMTRSRTRTISLRDNPGAPIHLPDQELSLRVDAIDHGAEILTLRGLPTAELSKSVKDSTHPIAHIDTGALWRLCRQRLLGTATGFKIRAVDTRNAIEKVEKITNGRKEYVWIAPGEIEIDVSLPEWVKWGPRK